MARTTINHSQGDAGQKPPDGEDFQSGDIADPQTFDWLFDTVPDAIDDHADEFDRLDSNNDGKVDAADSADTATEATNVTSTYKNNDIDSNGDGIVDKSHETQSVEVRSNDPSSIDGRIWIRNDL